MATTWWPTRRSDFHMSFIRDQALALRRIAVNVRVVVIRRVRPSGFRRSESIAPLEEGVTPSVVRGLAIPERWAFRLAVYQYRRLLRKALRSDRVNDAGQVLVVHSQTMAEPAIAVGLEAGLPVVVVSHGEEPESPRYRSDNRKRRYRESLERANRVIAVGPRLAGVLRAEAPGADVRVVLNGFDSALVERVLAETPTRSAPPRIVSVANLVPGTGFPLVRAALGRRRAAGGPAVRYDGVGDGPERGALEEAARNHGLSDDVRFLGFLDREATFRAVAGARAFVLPSAPEACGIVYLEAMGLGVVPVAARGQGPDAFLRDGENGLLVERSVEGVAGALDLLLADGEGPRRMAEAARRDARAHTWERAAERFLDAISDPPLAPRTRPLWLSVYNEPTPYVAAKLDAVERAGVPLRRAWLGAGASQAWGSDAPYAEEDLVAGLTRWGSLVMDVLGRRYDGVHLGGWGGDRKTLSLLLAARVAGVPLTVETDTHRSPSRGLKGFLRRSFLRFLDGGVRAWLPGGSPQARHLREAFGPRAPVVVERMTTATPLLLSERDRLGPGAGARWREERGIGKEEALVLFVGRLAPEKGLDDLAVAVQRLSAGGRKVRLVLAGPGDPAAVLPATFPAGLLAATGRLPWKGLVPLYLAADVLALPSRVEPWGLVVNEALLLGCPVVVTEAVGAAEDLVRDPGAGLVVPAGDASSLAAALAQILDAGGRNSPFAEKGRKVMEGWTTEGAGGGGAETLRGAARPA